MLDQLETVATFLAKHGLPIIVCAGGIVVLVMVVRTIWLPRLKARAELQTKKDEAEFERQQKVAEMEVTHQAAMQELQEEERKAAIELTKVTQAAVRQIKASQDSIVNPLEELIEAHRDWRVGWQFETVALKRFVLACLKHLRDNDKLDNQTHDYLHQIIDRGIKEEQK